MDHAKKHFNHGFSILELLVTLAVLGILLSVSVVSLNPPNTRVFADELKAMIAQSRYEAVKRNRPVAFFWNAEEQAFTTRFDANSSQVSAACAGDDFLVTRSPTEYRNMTVTTRNLPTNGIVWLPTGQGRTCGGAPMTGSEIELADGNGVRVVDISIGGKVSIQ